MLTIVLFHYLQKLELPYPFNSYILFGGTGIHLFILISGFGLYLSAAKKPLKYFEFLKKRLSKVYTPYIAIVLISAVVTLFIPIYESSWYALGGHVFLYKMFDESIVGSYGYQLWFISMILQFYFTFHLILYFRRKTSAFWFITISLIISISWSVLVAYLNNEAMRVWNSFFLQYLWEFALGIVLAERYLQNKLQVKLSNLKIVVIAILGCFLYAFMAIKGGSIGRLFNDIPALLGYSALAVWLYRIKIKPINKFLLYVGEVSFSLFLIHMLILELALQLFPAFPLYIILILALGITFPLCNLFQKGIGKLYQVMGF